MINFISSIREPFPLPRITAYLKAGNKIDHVVKFCFIVIVHSQKIYGCCCKVCFHDCTSKIQ